MEWLRSAPIHDGLVAAAFLAYAFAVDSVQLAAATPFLERDPTLSYAYTDPPTVPMPLLVFISIGIPTLIIIPTVLLRGRLSRLPFLRQALPLLLRILLTFLLALGVTLAATNTIKSVAGRQRPNFFAYCDYAGYRAVSASGAAGNRTEYDALTSTGAFGSTSKCRGDAADVIDAQRSFPSGHSSLSFCGMTFLVLFLRWALGVRRTDAFSPLAVLALTLTPLALAAWVALSRVRDRFHNHDDISVGSAIGALASWLAWRNFAGKADRNPFLEVGGGDADSWPLGQGKESRPSPSWPRRTRGEDEEGQGAADNVAVVLLGEGGG